MSTDSKPAATKCCTRSRSSNPCHGAPGVAGGVPAIEDLLPCGFEVREVDLSEHLVLAVDGLADGHPTTRADHAVQLAGDRPPGPRGQSPHRRRERSFPYAAGRQRERDCAHVRVRRAWLEPAGRSGRAGGHSSTSQPIGLARSTGRNPRSPTQTAQGERPMLVTESCAWAITPDGSYRVQNDASASCSNNRSSVANGRLADPRPRRLGGRPLPGSFPSRRWRSPGSSYPAPQR
jgi:hypothetical protein